MNNNSNKKIIIRKIISFTVGIISLLFTVACDTGPRETNCYWCGQTEQCYKYDLQYVDGYNPDGNFKFSHKIVNMSSKCADEARNSGKYTNVTMT
ncbi:MAG: hypothetical protein K6G33_08845 [Ruminococcus sp.]|uniref:hypothetical protein n=1 Tax=Ruminococcus sp. TaxID=41978 RepID=UPI0025D14141|nr:hypothetical protein [Ruminococcus sp.]MCR5600828.1 hypothetical protein [Ruminococcus sp.]